MLFFLLSSDQRDKLKFRRSSLNQENRYEGEELENRLRQQQNLDILFERVIYLE